MKRHSVNTRIILTALLCAVLCLTACSAEEQVKVTELPVYSGEAVTVINDGKPLFTKDELTKEAFEIYAERDELGRVGVAYACICKELMPGEVRGSIGMVRPTGWVQNKYEGIIDSDPPYLYNRCHLIAYQLSGENANEDNLITGTRQMNLTMLEYEILVADYVLKTGHHVLYRVTPYFEGNELLSRGVRIEAQSVEDDVISFHVFCHNVQPGIAIDYVDGSNYAETRSVPVSKDNDPDTFHLYNDPFQQDTDARYVLNLNSMRVHHPGCPSVPEMAPKNYATSDLTIDELEAQGYKRCGRKEEAQWEWE